MYYCICVLLVSVWLALSPGLRKWGKVESFLGFWRLSPSAQLVIRLRSLVGDATCVCGLSPLPLALDKDELNRLGSHTSISWHLQKKNSSPEHRVIVSSR